MLKLKKLVFTFRFHFVFLALSFLLTFIFTYRLGPGQFLFMGDQFIRFNFYEAYKNAFFLRKWENLGVLNAWQLMVQFYDVLYYLVVYKLGLSLINAEKILFFLFLFIQTNLSFVGFKKLRDLYKINVEDLTVFFVTLWFCFNPYTIVMWHGGLSFLGLAITYSLFPLLLFYFHLALFNTLNFKNIAVLSILMFLSSFVFWLYAVIIFMLIVYTISYLIKHRNSIPIFVKNVLILAASYLVLVLPILYTILHEYSGNSGDLNGQFQAMYSQLKGGLWYQFLMYFSWGIYNIWTPRSLYPFTDYFFSPLYIGATLMIYAVIIAGSVLLYKKEKKFPPQYFIFIMIFLISLFFSKGVQAPLGEIFTFMYNHVPFFSVFRSPDHRFGYSIVFALSILLLFTAQKLNRYVFVLILSLIILGQSNILLSGRALYGENKENKFYDRTVSIPADYNSLAQYINHDDGEFGYVLPFPQTEYGTYHLSSTDTHIGQDILSKIIDKPFLYLSLTSGLSKRTAVELYSDIVQKNYGNLGVFPIKYILVRKDIECTDCNFADETALSSVASVVFTNDTFKLYKLNSFNRLISVFDGTNGQRISDYDYKIIDPNRYIVNIKNVVPGKPLIVYFGLSANDGWMVAPFDVGQNISSPDKSYANLWQVVPQSSNVSFSIYYNPDSMFVVCWVLSILYLAGLLAFISRNTLMQSGFLSRNARKVLK